LKRLAARRFAGGFTLVEITIVLFILGLLIAGLIGPLETQLEARDRQQTLDAMNEIAEALYGYALTNGRLPCPDSAGDGLENVTAGVCDQLEGFLPWADLAAAPGDAWGNRFRYRIFSDYTVVDDGLCVPADGNFDLCVPRNDPNQIVVQSRGDNPATPPPATEGKFLITGTGNIPALIISHGRNGFGATSTEGNPRPPVPATNADETENSNGDRFFMSRIYSRDQGGCADDPNEVTPLCAFDDIVVWLSPAILNNRMVVAGRLP
jgi:type II secretory pathway pseudopilin PulG